MTTHSLKVKIELGATDLFYATSPDLPGLSLCERKLETLHELIPASIEYLYSITGRKVISCERGRVTGLENEANGWFFYSVTTDAIIKKDATVITKRERVAKALTAWMNGVYHDPKPDWESMPQAIRNAYLDQADAAISAIEE